MNVLAQLKNIQLFVLDVDGVLTDGFLMLMDNGEMARKMNVKDGYAMQLAIKKGYEIVIISGGNSQAVKTRLQRLGIQQIHLGITDKKTLLAEYVASTTYTWDQILYMGDDVPDVAPMQMVGVACAPNDAVPEVIAVAHYISPLSGGNGCVRDVIEKVLKLNNDWEVTESVASI
ncbi:KdsC family phosphatase [Ferruginibacter yonginensis]|uniref:KdsC family phosphatase n=1 Tax=Ferruginibacter yonginensis TaxID=1310416 RepID=A0ABV8QMR9_9BACT